MRACVPTQSQHERQIFLQIVHLNGSYHLWYLWTARCGRNGRPDFGSQLEIAIDMLLPVAIMFCDFVVQGAAGIADILFGKTSPSGKLPVTFYYDNYTTIQTMSNMDMRSWPGRTYRSPAMHAVSCCHSLYRVLYFTVPRAVLCCAARCRAVPCCAVLCCAVLCCAVLQQT